MVNVYYVSSNNQLAVGIHIIGNLYQLPICAGIISIIYHSWYYYLKTGHQASKSLTSFYIFLYVVKKYIYIFGSPETNALLAKFITRV